MWGEYTPHLIYGVREPDNDCVMCSNYLQSHYNGIYNFAETVGKGHAHRIIYGCELTVE